MRSYLGERDDLATAADGLLERGLLSSDAEQRWWLTDAGETERARIKQHVPAIREQLAAHLPT